MKKKSEHTIKELQEIAREATERAWNENFALGLPIVIEENGNIVKRYKDGSVTIIKKATIKIEKA
ncbi:MAG: hypothetical protein H7Z13_12560 [Ferruginibacter sp.]|nr:hypothetical protein [Ferruginibacter sp.]